MKKFSLKNFMFLAIAGMVNAFGITVFLMPVQLYDSGISGTSMLLAQITPDWFTLSMGLVILNFPLFLYGMKKQGIVFTVYAGFAVAVYSLGSWLITDVLPVDVSFASPLAGTDLLLCAIFGGFISGLGSGLAMRFGGAMDGIDVLAVLFARRIGISEGSFIMVYNAALYVVCGVILQSWILPLYSIVTYYVALKTIDFIVDGISRSKAAMIITTQPRAVSEALMGAFESGVTQIAATGAYSHTQRTILYFVINRYQISKLRNLVHEIDSAAYITITEVADVFSANNKS